MTLTHLHPRYQPDPSDPPWLAKVVELHGHLGPWVTLGARLGLAALQHLECPGYFDIQVVARGPFRQPPPSCLLDGLQATTGATLGKGNIRVEISEQVEVIATYGGRQVRLRPQAGVLDQLKNLDPNRVETLARHWAVCPVERLLCLGP